MRLISLLVFVWLIVGVVAAGQRGYLTQMSQSCGEFGTIALNVISGPLNYLGLDPKVTDCTLPEPSSTPE
ncbi:hypothetical protein BJY24_007750 [Nocardia transvalensis]|uniref:Uncharacterized protein n=1 Tax=Nocardia transvalensis TaxID=37333 RepID=A0A7W9PNF3_9NOCA|nr:hypothetical protein [Nocardia transvalensis]MBB5918838.1 hypothetical protein [Nocardia transvalensis]